MAKRVGDDHEQRGNYVVLRAANEDRLRVVQNAREAQAGIVSSGEIQLLLVFGVNIPHVSLQ